MDAYTIEPLCAEDIDALMGVANACFPVPWSAKTFTDELSRAQARIDGLRATPGGPLLAFIDYWIVLDEIHLLNVATLPDERRKGHARRLMDHMLRVARGSGCRAVLLEVRRSNTAALALYQAYGFRSVGLRAGYYPDNGEDAVLMTLDLEPSGSGGSPHAPDAP